MMKGSKIRQRGNVRAASVGTSPRGGLDEVVAGAAGAAHVVSPTSERIIRETSVKRRIALKLLANR